MANKISGIDGRPVQVGGGAPVSRARDTTSEGRKTETTGPSRTSMSPIPRARWPPSKIASRTLPVVSESRVDAVRRAMDEGRYHVDPQRVADKMMRFEVDLLAAIPAHK